MNAGCGHVPFRHKILTYGTCALLWFMRGRTS